MKRILLSLLFLILFISGTYAQSNSFNVVAGRTTVLNWTIPGDYTDYTLLFVAKTDRQLSSPRILQKDVTATYYKNHTVAKCTLSVDDTDDLTTNAFYYYDVAGYGVDTITFAAGRLNIYSPTQTSFDGTTIAEGTRVTTIALDNGTLQNEMIAWDTTLTKWVPSGVTYQSAEVSTFFDLVQDSLAQPIKKIYGVITDGTVTTWNVFGFASNATHSISGDTLVVTDLNGELNLEGIVSSNDQDYTIVSSTVNLLKVEWGGFTSKTISFIWQTDTISTAFVEYSGTSNTYNYDFDTLSFRTFSDLKYLENGDSTQFRTFSDAKYLANGDSTQFRTYSDLKYATASGLAAIADSNFVLTSETSAWDKNASDDALFYTGTDSIHYGEDSIVVSHGVGSTPQFVAIQLMSDSFGYRIWVSGINSLTFYVRRNDPLVLDTPTTYIKFKWMAYK